jgi:tetratricopeptide (TPR) repeat protein
VCFSKGILSRRAEEIAGSSKEPLTDAPAIWCCSLDPNHLGELATKGSQTMNDKSDTNTPVSDSSWLERDAPEIYYLLHALESDREALRWLRHKGEGLHLFAKALDGDKPALDELSSREPAELGGLFDTIAHCDVEQWLDENHPDLHRLFAFVRGDESALRGLKHKKVTQKRLAEILRAKYRDYHEEDGEEPSKTVNSPAKAAEGTAADVGCLIGEMHLRESEFHKAVDAFSRAIDTNPTADAYEGRARAYRALASLDVDAAQLLRGQPKH